MPRSSSETRFKKQDTNHKRSTDDSSVAEEGYYSVREIDIDFTGCISLNISKVSDVPSSLQIEPQMLKTLTPRIKKLLKSASF